MDARPELNDILEKIKTMLVMCQLYVGFLFYHEELLRLNKISNVTKILDKI